MDQSDVINGPVLHVTAPSLCQDKMVWDKCTKSWDKLQQIVGARQGKASRSVKQFAIIWTMSKLTLHFLSHPLLCTFGYLWGFPFRKHLFPRLLDQVLTELHPPSTLSTFKQFLFGSALLKDFFTICTHCTRVLEYLLTYYKTLKCVCLKFKCFPE